jgi:hypothetical protein
MRARATGLALGFWLACGLAVLGQTGLGPAPTPLPATRDPALRQIDDRTDGALVKRIEFIRSTLPEEYRKRNNFAWAVAKIVGVKKTEYFAHSGIQDLDGLSSKAAKKIKTISLKPKAGQAKFKVLCVNQNGAVEGYDCWLRNVDTEFKILEDMAAQLKDPAAAGTVRLYTELYPCPSCWNVMKQFLAAYTNVQMEVLYRKN